ncbi:MAG TPA: hypothetical protein VHW23_18490 [Kofleriaceae bacterium]|jgi:hypothetical protein|nr:hypothetical protein [Kofleriaceae bacterium]
MAVLVVAAAALPRPARAQSAEAEELFQEGKRLMAKGDTAQACEKFEASDRVEAASGTELNLARCRETNGQFASAWAAYLKTAGTAKHNGNARREAEARKKAAALQSRLIYLTIMVPADVRVDGLVIKRDGTTVDEAAWNQRMPVDPAEYTVSSEAPGYKPWSTSVVVKTKSKTVEIPALEKQPQVRREPPREAPRTAGADDAAPSSARDGGAEGAGPRPAPSRWTGKRKLALALAAVGVAAGGTGIALGLHASSLEDQSDVKCRTTKCTNPIGVDLNTSARHYALAANVGFAVGGAAVIGAAVLWFLGAPPSRDGVTLVPALDHGRVSLSFARSF